jgi:hypothetical protein
MLQDEVQEDVPAPQGEEQNENEDQLQNQLTPRSPSFELQLHKWWPAQQWRNLLRQLFILLQASPSKEHLNEHMPQWFQHGEWHLDDAMFAVLSLLKSRCPQTVRQLYAGILGPPGRPYEPVHNGTVTPQDFGH